MRRGHRLDRLAQFSECEPVNACEQPSIAPLRCGSDCELSSQYCTFCLEAKERSLDFGLWLLHSPGQPWNLDRSGMRQPALYQPEQRILGRRGSLVDPGRSRLKLCRGKESRERLNPLRCDPEWCITHKSASASVLGDESTEEITPSGGEGLFHRGPEVFRQGHQDLQCFAQFVRITDIRPGSFTDLGYGVGIEVPDFTEHSLGQRAAQRDGPRAAFFERRVIEVRIGVGVENLVREL